MVSHYTAHIWCHVSARNHLASSDGLLYFLVLLKTFCQVSLRRLCKKYRYQNNQLDECNNISKDIGHVFSFYRQSGRCKMYLKEFCQSSKIQALISCLEQNF